jgi:hypothetical protein
VEEGFKENGRRRRRGAAMNEMSRIIASLVFVSNWYAMTLIGRALFKPYEKLKLVWCPEARNFSFVEIVAIPKAVHASAPVKRCLLWPKYRACSQRCVK